MSIVITYLESGQLWLVDLATQTSYPVSICDGYFGCYVYDWSPDGMTMVIKRHPSDGNKPRDIVLYSVEKDEIVVKINESGIFDASLDYQVVQDVSFSSDGQHLVWTIHGREIIGTSEIWITDRQGKHGRMLVRETGRILSSRWFTDESSIVYSIVDADNDYSVWQISVDSQTSETLFPDPSPRNNIIPVQSPDGQRAAFTHCEDFLLRSSIAEQTCTIAIHDYSTDDVEPIMAIPGKVYRNANWSPDGTLLAYSVTDENELESIWLYAFASDENYPITDYTKKYSNYVFVDAKWVMHSFDNGQETEQ